VVWRGPRRDRPLVVLAGHLDTVPAEGNERARREGDRLYGLGATDMKGGDAVMLALIESLDPARLRFDLAAVFYDGEEGPHEGNGLGRLLEQMPWLREAALAVLLEPTAAQAELGCNGVMNVEVRVRGKSAHAARPWTGVNAIERAAPWLAGIVRFPATPVLVQGLEFRETLQVTWLQSDCSHVTCSVSRPISTIAIRPAARRPRPRRGCARWSRPSSSSGSPTRPRRGSCVSIARRCASS
jgi:succinyl-diaminopimelate desuccinylase